MLTSIQIKNFKAWKDTGKVRLAPLTVIFGANSAGKSSLGHLLLALIKGRAWQLDEPEKFYRISNCTIALQLMMQKGKLAIDDRFRILLEYQNKTQPTKGRGLGDAFVKWALQNNANPARCDRVPITEHASLGFESFPDDADLVTFDPPDRKFVAVSAAHPEKPPILQAADSKWLGWAPALKKHGVHVEFLCKDDIQRFQINKAK